MVMEYTTAVSSDRRGLKKRTEERERSSVSGPGL
jgi:hypothetical protein